MGKIIFDVASTLNGFIADDDNSLEWLFAVDGGDQPEDGLYPANADVLVEGSTTYLWVLNQESLLESPQRWSELYGDKVTFVFTSRDLPVPTGADVRFLSGDVRDALHTIRAAAGDSDIWVVGGGELAGQFLDADALDQIAISLAPAVLTGGAPLLPRVVEPNRLRLVSAHAVGQFARVIYDVVVSASKSRD